MLDNPDASPEEIKGEVLKNIRLIFAEPKLSELNPPPAAAVSREDDLRSFSP